MTSPVEAAAKMGWFGSLRRNRNKSLCSTPDKLSPTKNGATINSTKTMTGAKSLSSLHTLNVNLHSTSSVMLNERLEDSSKSPQSSTTTPKTRWRLGTILQRSKKSDSSVDISNDEESPDSSLHRSIVVVQVPLPVVAEQLDDDNKNVSQFCTLPRKRLQTSQPNRVASRLLPPLPVTSRSRAYTNSSSTSSLDRRKKRSTVWYTHSDSDINGRRNGVSLFSLGSSLYLCRKSASFYVEGSLLLLFCWDVGTVRFVPTPSCSALMSLSLSHVAIVQRVR